MTGENDQLDELGRILNIVAGTMQSTILQNGYVTPRYTYQSLTESIIILNTAGAIQSISSHLAEKLGYLPSELLKIDISKLLSSDSSAYWQTVISEASTAADFQITLPLILVSKHQKLMPSFCTVSKLSGTNLILISTLSTVVQHTFSDLAFHEAAPRVTDAALVQQVYEYIINNLDEPLPGVKQLSRRFGTNEFRLKDSFRHFFNTSIYHFYLDQKLKRAHQMIEQTNLTFKEIALVGGFGDYPNFYKLFKKKYGYLPSDLLRPNDNGDEE